jgi:hypothetical protein
MCLIESVEVLAEFACCVEHCGDRLQIDGATMQSQEIEPYRFERRDAVTELALCRITRLNETLRLGRRLVRPRGRQQTVQLIDARARRRRMRLEAFDDTR